MKPVILTVDDDPQVLRSVEITHPFILKREGTSDGNLTVP
jgi:hypothetical protein